MMIGEKQELFVVVNERGVIFGPFIGVIAATAFADEACGREHAWRVMRLVRPSPKHIG